MAADTLTLRRRCPYSRLMRIDRLVCAAAFVLVGSVAETLQTPAPQQPPANTSPAVSPDGRQIAFVSTRDGNADLFVVAAGGGAERQLTRTPESEGRAEWSADGAQLIYAIAAGETTRLFSMDVATGASRQIGSVNARGAAVSPDLSRVAYTAGSWQASRLAVARVDGSAEQFLTTAEQSSIAGLVLRRAEDRLPAQPQGLERRLGRESGRQRCSRRYPRDRRRAP